MRFDERSEMHEADWKLICGGTIDEFNVWSNGDFDSCFEKLIFVCLPHIVHAIFSMYHFSRHQHRRIGGRIIYSWTLHSRLLTVIMLIITPVILILLLMLYDDITPNVVDIVTRTIQAITWLIHSGFVWRLQRLRHMSPRGPLSLIVTFIGVFLSSLVLLRTAILHRLYKTSDLSTPEEISYYITTALHLCHILTQIPSNWPPAVTSSLVNIQESVNAENEVDSDFRDVSLSSDEDEANILSRVFFCWVQPLLRKGAKGLLRSTDDVPRLPNRLRTENIEKQFRKVYTDGNLRIPCDRQFLNDPFDDQENQFLDVPNNNMDQISVETNQQIPNVIIATDNRKIDRSIKRPSLLKALNRAFGCEYYLLGILKFVSDGLSFVGPILLNLLLNFMENTSEPSSHGYLYASLLFLSTFFGSMFATHFSYRVSVVGLKLRAALVTTVYRKTLAVNSVELSAFSVGAVTNFMSVDTDRIVNFCPSFHQLWSLPVQVGVALYLLYQQVGLAFLAGLAFALILVPINRWLTIKIGQLSTSLMQEKDARVKIINEVLFGIRVLKFYAWEPHFIEKINTLREAELRSLKGRKYLDALCVYFWATTPVIISIITFTTYILMGHALTAAKVFTSIALFGILITPLNAFPWVLNGLMEAWVSLKRLQSFLDLQDLHWEDYYASDRSDDVNLENIIQLRNCFFSWTKNDEIRRENEIRQESLSLDDRRCLLSADDTLISTETDHLISAHSTDNDNHISTHSDNLISADSNDLRHVISDGRGCPVSNFKTSDLQATGTLKLKDINLTIQRGSFVGVVGKVGSGKSSFLSAILAEIHKESGDIWIDNLSAGFGLTLQEPWIQQMTVRDNILFGREYIKEKYERIIESCALIPDLQILPAGDMTEIGESGVTLSGGQKARIALARSIYQEKEVYLFDDPLAAVDAHVAQHLFEHCIMGLLKNKTRILVTHHTRFLRTADLVVVMKHGRIIECGAPSSSELISKIVFNSSASNDSAKYDDIMKDEEEEEEKEEELPKEGNGALVQDEEKDEGVVKLHVYKSYWIAVGHCLSILVFLSLFLMQASKNVSDWWLSYWVSHSNSTDVVNQTRSNLLNTTHGNVVTDSHKTFNFLLTSLTDNRYQISLVFSKFIPWSNFNFTNGTFPVDDNLRFYMTVYGYLAGANTVFTLARAFFFAYGGIVAATRIHRQLLQTIMKASIKFFDVTPVGRIINRFSSDVYSVDDSLPFILNIFVSQMFGVIGTVVICCYGLPFVSILIFILAVIYFFIQKYYRNTSRELKRLTSVTLSPIYAHFSETIVGLTTIRALRHVKRFCEENKKRLDTNQTAQFASMAITNWLNVWLQMIGIVMVTGVAVMAVIQRGSKAISPGIVGLAVSYVLSVTSQLSGLVMFFTETEKLMVSVERVGQYVNDIPKEEDDDEDKTFQHAPPSWSIEGSLSFVNVCLRYRPGLPNALDGISFEFRSGEKIGIVGRTGSGKSSLFLALFRIVEIESGQIFIDGIDIRSVPLRELRSHLAIIPQDPFLFSGSVRENIDPLNVHSDVVLLEMIERCHLKSAVESLGGLDAQVAERGRHFSVGQRQLMCLARALLSRAQILCIDEATANIDLATDKLIQQTIRDEFSQRTVLTIAHRIETILNSDRVLVLNAGKIIEFEAPEFLLSRSDSMFYSLVHSSS